MHKRWQSANLFRLDACVAIGDAMLVPAIKTIRIVYYNFVFEIETLVTT